VLERIARKLSLPTRLRQSRVSRGRVACIVCPEA
jgi:hypothetical protein